MLGAGVALLAWRAGALTRSGAVAAALVGTAILAGTGWWGGIALLTFFVGSTLVSRWCPDPAAERGEAKGGKRDAGQVLANGGVPALGALVGLVFWPEGFAALAAGLAVAAADTWATSLGATSPTPPRHLLTFTPVAAGTSGGVTWRGTFGGVAGAATVALVALLATRHLELSGIILVIGFTGMLIDSVLGAVAQGRSHCDRCDRPTERAVHSCGASTRRVGGIGWLGNDGVNALATTLGTLLGLAYGTVTTAMLYYQR